MPPYCSCRKCQNQKGKMCKRKYGKLPPKDAITRPWHTVCVDLIGPFDITDHNSTTMEVMCLTIIDPATGWFEIAESSRNPQANAILERVHGVINSMLRTSRLQELEEVSFSQPHFIIYSLHLLLLMLHFYR